MFGEEYANLYNAFHSGKDYSMEVQIIIESLNLDLSNKLTGFDFGCGTGAHAHEFRKLGIYIDGFDVSPDMLTVAKKLSPELIFSDSLNNLKKIYDFTYSLFDVLSYQVNDDDAFKLLSCLHERTKIGGFCLVDSWNSKGVYLDPPKINERTVSSPYGNVTRRVTPNLSNAKSDLYNLTIDLILDSSGEILKSERHLIRAWKPLEVLEIMSEIGFQKLEVLNPRNPGTPFRDEDWRFGIRAKK